MSAVHIEVLAAARTLATAANDWTFRLAAIVAALPQLNAATVRTHVASRCCINAPANHQSRYRYFRALGRGIYRVEAPFRGPLRTKPKPAAWQDRVLSSLDTGVDGTLIAEALWLTPTERLEQMRRAARSLEAM